MQRAAVALAVLIGSTAAAHANGRAPATSTIHFQRGNPDHIIAGMTFGLVTSLDGGATWRWVCEDAIGYGGMYDPDYVFTPSGALLATTFTGLKANRDQCSYLPASTGTRFVSTQAQGADDAIYVAMAAPAVPNTDPGDSNIYRSTDDGVTFPTSSKPGQVGDWWQSLEVAPSNAQRLYLTGYRFVKNPDAPGNIKVFLLFRSDDAGATWTALPVTDFVTMPNSTLDLVGISATDPQKLFARVTLTDNTIADALYRSTNGGQSWTKILDRTASIAFALRASGQLVAATQAVDLARSLGAYKSDDDGATWTALPGAPHINCLSERPGGELWACTQNYGGQTAPSDGFGIMKTTDLATWTGVFKFQALQAPVTCAAGSVQHDTCDVLLWCGLCAQLGCDAGRACAGAGDPTPPVIPAKDDGCCDAGARPPTTAVLVLILAVAMVVLRPRRARR